MVQGRSTNIISMIQWIQTSRLPIKNALSLWAGATAEALVMKDLDKFEMCLQADEYEAAQVPLLIL